MMKKIFDVDNPVWKFIGNLADFFLLSVYWYICAVLIVPFGAGTTAMNTVTMNIAANTEGYTTQSFIKAIKSNFKRNTVVGLIYIIVGLMIVVDFLWIFFGQPKIGIYFLPAAIVIGILYMLNITIIFPIMVYYESNAESLIKIGFVYSIRKLLPIFSCVILTIGIFSFGVFVFWPILLVAPGLSAYFCAFIFNRLFAKVDMPEGTFHNAV